MNGSTLSFGLRLVMKRLASLVLILLFPLLAASKAADITDSMNADAFWKGIAFRDYKAERLQGKRLPLPKADTMFVVASNRAMQLGQTKFMSEERGTDHLNYFLVFLKNGQWNVWHTSFRTAMAAMNIYSSRDWVVYTEGFGKIFTTGLYRGIVLTGQYKVNVLYLDYPSYNTSKKMMGNYYFALDNAKQSGEDFAPVFDTLKQYRTAGKMGNGHLTFFFHSMGNNMIREMMLQNRLASINNEKWVDNVILNSACVPQKNHAEWVNRIDFTDRIYINYNPKDATLSGANFMSLKKQLGQHQYSQQSEKAIYVNFNTLCNRNHSNFLSLAARKPAMPAAISYYNTILHGNCAMLEDGRCFQANKEHKADYTILDAVPQTTEETTPVVSASQQQHDAALQSKPRPASSETSGGSSSAVLH